MRKSFVLALAALALAGCKPGEDGEVQTSLRSQAAVVATPWMPVSPAETRVSILGDDPVTARRSRWEPAKKLYAEAMQTRNGLMLFERRRRVPAGQALPPEEELLKRYATSNAVAEAGIALKKEAVRRRSLENGEIAWLVGESRLKCVVFFMYSPGSVFEAKDGIEPKYEAITGSACEKPGSKRAAALEDKVLDLAARVRFDEGRFSRSKIFAQALQQLREKPLAEDVEPVAVAGDRSGPQVQVAERVETEKPLALLEGRVADASPLREVRLDQRWVHVAADGRFRTLRPVAPGTNRLKLEAVDVFGNRTLSEVVVEAAAAAQPDDRPLEQRVGTFHALVIGVKSYQAPIPGLVTPIADAQELSRVLRQDYGFKVTTLLDATKAEIIAAIAGLRDTLRENDNLLIYYAGHGILDPETNLGYWLPADARHDSPDNWISNTHVSRLIRAIPARHVVLVADSCYSGAFAREQNLLAGRTAALDPEETLWLRSRTTFSSGELEEVLDEGGGNHSLFAMHFLDTLKKNGGVVSGARLSSVVRGLVRNEAAQTPQYGAVISAGHDEGGDFLFVRRGGGRS